ncbi:MAG: HAD family acid phosphatase, partial [Planctomycetota bacterium]
AACTSAPPANDLLLATLYVNASAEYDAACRTVYAAAIQRLEDVAARSSRSDRPLAMVMDVDETVLDNSPYEARLVEDGTSYPEDWDAWCMEAAAPAVPGASDCIQRARQLGIEVFFVTNRKAHLEEGTRVNLEHLGLFEARSFDTLLMRGERPEWTSDKSSRRGAVEATHEIVALVGDNVRDFFEFKPEEPTNSERASAVDARAAEWGTRWFMLPNPMYGGWDEAAVEYDYGAPAGTLRALRRAGLDDLRADG